MDVQTFELKSINDGRQILKSSDLKVAIILADMLDEINYINNCQFHMG